jgi:hypothetical protein
VDSTRRPEPPGPTGPTHSCISGEPQPYRSPSYSEGKHTAVVTPRGVVPVGLYQEQPQVERSPLGCSGVGGWPERNIRTSFTAAASATSIMQLPSTKK